MNQVRKIPAWTYIIIGIVVLVVYQKYQLRPTSSLQAVSRESHNIYSGPHVRNYEVIGTLPANKQIKLTGRHIDSWVTFYFNGYQGWVQAFYLDIDGNLKRLPEVDIPASTPPGIIAKEEDIISYFHSVISDDRYNPNSLVLHKYINSLDVDIDNNILTFTLAKDTHSMEDFVSLAVDLIFGSAIISNAGEDSDWGLSKIELISPGPRDSYASLYVSGHQNIAIIAEDSSKIYDLMRDEVSYGEFANSMRNDISTQSDFDNESLNESTGTGCPIGCTIHKEGCDIKGNISLETGEKIYHLPNQEYYSETVINPQYGERWFCSEQEAIANGWRKSYH